MMRLSFTASKNIRLALLRLKHKIRYPRRSVFSNSLSISSAYSIERYSHLYGTLTPISEHAEINLGIGLHARGNFDLGYHSCLFVRSHLPSSSYLDSLAESNMKNPESFLKWS